MSGLISCLEGYGWAVYRSRAGKKRRAATKVLTRSGGKRANHHIGEDLERSRLPTDRDLLVEVRRSLFQNTIFVVTGCWNEALIGENLEFVARDHDQESITRFFLAPDQNPSPEKAPCPKGVNSPLPIAIPVNAP